MKTNSEHPPQECAIAISPHTPTFPPDPPSLSLSVLSEAPRLPRCLSLLGDCNAIRMHMTAMLHACNEAAMLHACARQKPCCYTHAHDKSLVCPLPGDVCARACRLEVNARFQRKKEATFRFADGDPLWNLENVRFYSFIALFVGPLHLPFTPLPPILTPNL